MGSKSVGLRAASALALSFVFVSGCVFEFSETPKREHMSVGAEVYRTVCMRLAAQAFPEDLTGEKFEGRCAGTDATPFAEQVPTTPDRQRALVRYNALLRKRSVLVPALDAAFNSQLIATDELRNFLGKLVPLYDGEELLPQVTRATSKLLTDLINQNDQVAAEAINAFERMGARNGYRPLKLALGVARPVLEYPELDQLVTGTLDSLKPATAQGPAGSARGAWEELLRSAALDLATADATPANPKKPGTLAIARKLLLAENAVFSGGRGPLYLTRRDHRGIALAELVNGKIPSPLLDDDKDGLVDIDATGRIRLFSPDNPNAPTPFTTLTATLLNQDQGMRDAAGRALNATATSDICAGMTPAAGCGNACDAMNPCGEGLTCGSAGKCVWDQQPPRLYQYINADRTMLAGVTRDIGPLLIPKDGAPQLTAAAVHDFAFGLSAVLGDFKQQSATFGGAQLSFVGPDTTTGPVFDLVHAFGSLLPYKETDQLLEVLEILLRDHEKEVAGLIEASLYIDQRADAYPNAKWETPHEFWDDLIVWTQRALKRDGLLEAMLRATATEQSAKSGPLIGNFMRYRDRASFPLGKKEELEALGIDVRQVVKPSTSDPTKIRLLVDPCSGNNPANGCGATCSITKPCPGDLACAVDADPKSTSGKCTSVAAAVQAHRSRVNFPCPALPTSLGAAPAADCTPLAPLPAAHHQGMKNCPAPDQAPMEGASCAELNGMGLCSFDAGTFQCDCGGGLCRPGAPTATWRKISDKPTPGYAVFVDRMQPDVRVGMDGQTNQSLFQRTAALVHDLHVPALLCNKDKAKLGLYDPAGGASESPLGGLLGPILPVLGAGGALDPKDKCGVLNEPQIVRFFSRAILGTAVLDLKDPALRALLNNLESLTNGALGNIIGLIGINPAALGRNEVMQRQSQLRGLFVGGVSGTGQTVPSPRPGAVARMVFAPFNPFEAGLLDLPLTRDNEVIADLHRDTIFAWEMTDPVSGVSYYEALSPLLKAFDDHELYNDKGELVDGYLFGDLISLVHKHWSSRNADSTVRMCDDTMSPPLCDEKAKFFGYQSNGVSYEELAAEALIDAQLMARLRDVMSALDNIEIEDENGTKIDGITVMTNAAKNLFDPERACGPSGCEMQPLTNRDGTKSTKSNTGKTVEKLAPIYLLLDALNGIDKRFEGPNEQRLAPWREARSQLVDLLLDVQRSQQNEWRLKNPRSRAVLLNVLGFLRDRLATYKSEDAACLMNGGNAMSCQNLRAWAFGLSPRLATSLGQPVSAATFRLLDQFWGVPSNPGGELLKLVHYISREQAQTPSNETFDTTLLAVTDMLQLFENTENTAPVMRFLSTAVAPNALAVAANGQGELVINEGSIEKTLELLRRIKAIDVAPAGQQSTLTKVLRAMATPHGANGETPLEIIIDVIAEVNRARPIQDDGASMTGADLRAVLKESRDFLSSERHGLERLYDIIQSRNLP